MFDTLRHGKIPMKPSTSILSFDVGIRHLAYCLLVEVDSSNVTIKRYGRIDAWDMIDLGKVSSVEECAKKLTAELVVRFASLPPIDFVIIERQPRARSIMMVAIQMFLCMYFSSIERSHRVCFSSASRKLCMQLVEFPKGVCMVVEEAADASDADVKGKKKKARATKPKGPAAIKYALNKSYAVDATKKYLEYMEDYGNMSLLDAYKKKDDLADAFLQAVAFIENDGVCTRPQSTYKRRKSKVVPKEKSVSPSESTSKTKEPKSKEAAATKEPKEAKIKPTSSSKETKPKQSASKETKPKQSASKEPKKLKPTETTKSKPSASKKAK